MGGKRKKKENSPLFPFPSSSVLPFPSSSVLNSGMHAGRTTQRNNVQEGSVSNSRTTGCLLPPLPILAPKLLVLRRARSWNNLVRRVLPRVADTNPTLASCSLVRVYRGRESSLTSPGATSFLHDLNVDTYTYIYASACTVGDFEAKLRLPSCFSRPRYRTSPTKRF